MNLVDRLQYHKTNFLWVTNHYDIHWEGTCVHPIYGLCRFKTVDVLQEGVWCDHCDGDKDNEPCTCPVAYGDCMCDIYHLTTWERIKSRLDQWAFEVCIGKHWTYPDRMNGARFTKSMDNWLFRFYNWVK